MNHSIHVPVTAQKLFLCNQTFFKKNMLNFMLHIIPSFDLLKVKNCESAHPTYRVNRCALNSEAFIFLTGNAYIRVCKINPVDGWLQGEHICVCCFCFLRQYLVRPLKVWLRVQTPLTYRAVIFLSAHVQRVETHFSCSPALSVSTILTCSRLQKIEWGVHSVCLRRQDGGNRLSESLWDGGVQSHTLRTEIQKNGILMAYTKV